MLTVTSMVWLALAAPPAEAPAPAPKGALSVDEARAEYQQGLRYRDGIDGEIDFERAYKHFLAAAEANFWPAMREVMLAHEYGLGVDADQGKAGEWSLKIDGAIVLGRITGYDSRPDEDPLDPEPPARASEAQKKLHPARYLARIKESANRGHPKSQFILSQLTEDAAEKLVWLERSAKNGHNWAKVSLGRYYFERAEEMGPGSSEYRQLVHRAYQELSEGLDNLIVLDQPELANPRTWNIKRYGGKTMGEWKELEQRAWELESPLIDAEQEELIKQEAAAQSGQTPR